MNEELNDIEGIEGIINGLILSLVFWTIVTYIVWL